MTNFILGLDISTAVTGITILDDTGKLIVLDHVITTQEPDLWMTVDAVMAKIVPIITIHPIDYFYAEESLQRFRSGFSSAHTLSTLAKVNGIVSYEVRKATRVDPRYIDSASARKLCGIKLRKATTPLEKKDPRWTKQQVFDQMLNLYPDLRTNYWPLTKPTGLNPTGRLKDFCFDRVDSYVIAMAAVKRDM